ncbi:hypothetical protein AMECASPLE_034884 [Ameca splendens]|uniref:Uncharacterized protein n=1 Tax=Ameca splendens TaxID=208324 RepID=A0ABV0ZS23_9TELE
MCCLLFRIVSVRSLLDFYPLDFLVSLFSSISLNSLSLIYPAFLLPKLLQIASDCSSGLLVISPPLPVYLNSLILIILCWILLVTISGGRPIGGVGAPTSLIKEGEM